MRSFLRPLLPLVLFSITAVFSRSFGAAVYNIHGISLGMSSSEVRRLLGPPERQTMISESFVTGYWSYPSGPSLGTLGMTIYFNQRDDVQAVFGSPLYKGRIVVADGGFSEVELSKNLGPWLKKQVMRSSSDGQPEECELNWDQLTVPVIDGKAERFAIEDHYFNLHVKIDWFGPEAGSR